MQQGRLEPWSLERTYLDDPVDPVVFTPFLYLWIVDDPDLLST